MSDLLEIPVWYPLQIYKNDLTPEEWLQEVWRRVKFKNLTILHLTHEEIIKNGFKEGLLAKQKLFISMIVKNNTKNILNSLKPQLGQPVKPISIFEVLHLTSEILNSEWYKKNPDRNEIEDTIATIQAGETPSDEQNKIISKYIDLPWHTYHENHGKKNWYPKLRYNHGAPVTIDADFYREDILFEIRRFVTLWTGKKKNQKRRPLSKAMFNTWKTKKILALFDLLLWYEICEIKCPKIEIARLLWPKLPRSKKNKNGAVGLKAFMDNAVDLCNKVFHEGTVKILFIACESRKHQLKK